MDTSDLVYGLTGLTVGYLLNGKKRKEMGEVFDQTLRHIVLYIRDVGTLAHREDQKKDLLDFRDTLRDLRRLMAREGFSDSVSNINRINIDLESYLTRKIQYPAGDDH